MSNCISTADIITLSALYFVSFKALTTLSPWLIHARNIIILYTYITLVFRIIVDRLAIVYLSSFMYFMNHCSILSIKYYFLSKKMRTKR